MTPEEGQSSIDIKAIILSLMSPHIRRCSHDSFISISVIHIQAQVRGASERGTFEDFVMADFESSLSPLHEEDLPSDHMKRL